MVAKPVSKALAVTAFVSLCATSALASAEETSSGAGLVQGQTETAPKDRSRRICRNVIPTGSRMGQRVCRTQAEWDARSEEQRQMLEDGQTNGMRRDGEFQNNGMTQPR